ARAAYATAWAWLPALPQTTPVAQPSPSEAILASAPRSLNDPVRCRFSAFRTTVDPSRSDSVRELRTGVSRTTPAPASTAPSTAASVTAAGSDAAGEAEAVVGSVRERHHRVDLDAGALGQRGDGDRDPGGRIAGEERGVDLV